MGLCRCCGFKASEVHHVIPLTFNGTDDIKNMVSLCSICHKHSPNTKSQFYQYMKKGGAKTIFLLGVISQSSQELEGKNGVSFMYYFNLGKKILNSLREIDFSNALENYNLKDSEGIEDVDFSDCLI